MQAVVSCGAALAAPWPVLWAPLFSAIAIALVSGFGAYIAFRQWLTAQTKVQLELYEKRRPIYDATNDFLVEIARDGKPNWASLSVFSKDVAHAQFIFDLEMATYLDGLRIRATDMAYTDRRLSRDVANDDSEALADKLHGDMEWMTVQLKELPERFAPYLQLTERANRLPRLPWRREPK